MANETADLPDGVPGRLLALALTALVLAAFWLGVAAPLAGWYGERDERLTERRVLERRMQGVAATLPELRREAGANQAAANQAAANQAGANSAGGQPAASALLEGASDAVAAARLQETMQALAARAGATVSSLETLPAEPAGPYRRIGLRVALNAPWPVLVALLQAAEQSRPPLLLDDLRLQATPLPGQPMRPIDAVFTVIAFRAAAPPAPSSAPSAASSAAPP